MKYVINIELPLPGRVLNPNGRAHWAEKQHATNSQRNMAAMLTLAALRKGLIEHPWPSATVQPTYRFATNRRRDGDNFNASLKSALDGIADSGLVRNDTVLTLLPPKIVVEKGCKPGVTLTIENSPHG